MMYIHIASYSYNANYVAIHSYMKSQFSNAFCAYVRLKIDVHNYSYMDSYIACFRLVMQVQANGRSS